jgi:hypothetical protein
MTNTLKESLDERSRESLGIISTDTFDLDALTSERAADACPVIGCKRKPIYHATKGFLYCADHGLEIHRNTFIYYNGETNEEKRQARLRNFLPFLQEFAKTSHLLDNKHKAESHRLGAENSEDALTYNILGGLHCRGHLPKLFEWLTGEATAANQLKLFLWGLEIDIATNSLIPWQPLLNVRGVLEKGIHRFLTEPDIVILGPKHLVFIEAKFTSGNPLCIDGLDCEHEKPKSRAALIKRYIENNTLWKPAVLSKLDVGEKVHSQLLRMIVFASTIAPRIDPGIDWLVVNLVSETQWKNHKHAERKGYDFEEPSSAIPGNVRDRLKFLYWEQLYREVLSGIPDLQDVQQYFQKKTANLEKAFNV